VVSLVVWLVALMALMWLLGRGYTSVQATMLVFVTVVVFYWGKSVTDALGSILGWLVVAALVIALANLIRGVDWDMWIRVGLVAVSVALVSGPLLDVIRQYSSRGSDLVVDDRQLSASMHSTPDIWLVVLDGHPGAIGMELDFPTDAVEAFRTSMSDAGLAVHESAWASYWATDYSLPSLLNMGYPANDLTENDTTKSSLYEMVGGHNRLVSLLGANGYETYMVESGWSGSPCTNRIDNCVASTWLDEPMFFMLARSMMTDFILSNVGYAFTAGAKRTMSWSLENAASIAADGVASFVLVHVMAPHAPYFLDQNCDVRFADDRSGVTFHRAGAGSDERQAHLTEQMTCIHSFIAELARSVDEETVLVAVSDHGTDRRYQMVSNAGDWSEEAVIERMSALLATSSAACDVGGGVMLPNVMRRVIGCFVEGGLEEVSPRMYLGRNRQLTGQQLVDLINGRPAR
jgi:hypothetical protein